MEQKTLKNGNLAEEAQEERKRYITRLYRRAQTQIANDLGAEGSRDGVDELVGAMIHQIIEETGARCVTLYRPVPRGQRWHVASALANGGRYYGLAAPESVVLPMLAFTQRRSIVFGPASGQDLPSPRPDEFGYHSYIGVPVLNGGEVIAVVEAVDFEQTDHLDLHVGAIEKLMAMLCKIEQAPVPDKPAPAEQPMPPPPPTHGLSEASVLDLVLRLQLNSDAVIEISPDEWKLLNQLNGERPLSEIAQAAGKSPEQAISIAASLLGRGLIKEGREHRRRG
jgi:GAF domain-containing protein